MINFAFRIARRAAAPLAAVSFSTISLTHCEAAIEQQRDKKSIDLQGDLPGEDEPTQCLICKVNRQGPCRDPWRRFERCMKTYGPKDERKDAEDSPGKEDDEKKSFENGSLSAVCDDFMLPWLECLQNHRNLYMMLNNEASQDEFVDPYESDLKYLFKAKPQPWRNLDIDWSDLWGYAEEKGMKLQDFGGTQLVDWKEFLSGPYGGRDLDDYVDERDVVTVLEYIVFGDSRNPSKPIYDADTYQGDPALIEVRVRVQLEDEGGVPIDLCYARDQTGRVIGVEYFTSQKEQGIKEDVLRLYIEPSKTVSIKLFKVYKSDVTLKYYVSKARFLVEAAFEAGIE